MEHLTGKPYYLTDEDILWVGTTLADMMPVECHTAAEVIRASSEGYATMIRCDQQDASAMERYGACIDAGVLYVWVPFHLRDDMAHALRDQFGFNGVILHDEAALREDFIRALGIQAALGLHNK